MARDHSFLVGAHDMHFAAALTHDWCTGGVASVIEHDPEVLETATDLEPDRRGVLADAAGEHQGLDAAERGRERADRLARVIAEHVDRKCSARLARAKLEQP